uniref:Peptidase C1A papain C-terminal domain-containing protein n=1 Tax=Terrapene triunguis TaxID=2587831 RepID=A0A674J7Q0_9SAUR
MSQLCQSLTDAPNPSPCLVECPTNGLAQLPEPLLVLPGLSRQERAEFTGWLGLSWWRVADQLASSGSYPGLAANGYCHYNSTELLANITGYVNVTALRAAVFKNGPVAVSIDASLKSFIFYSNGIYYDPQCGESLNHAVLAVGYGVLQEESYWLIKNSWSTFWGNDGYILLSMQDNNCGVATAATYPVLA